MLYVWIIFDLQAMPQLTDRSKLPNIVDPVIENTMDQKHLYQVCRMKTLIFWYFVELLNLWLILSSNQVAAVAVLCVQPEPSYRPLITDVLHSLIPLVPSELRGSLRFTEPTKPVCSGSSNWLQKHWLNYYTLPC